MENILQDKKHKISWKIFYRIRNIKDYTKYFIRCKNITISTKINEERRI